MAKLINGNGNAAIYANQDADLIASLAGNVTAIAAVGNEFEATQEDANTIGLADGVIVTKEGRRIQLDDGSTDLFTIPTGTAGTTSYYIIGYKLSTQADSSQTCETFVQKMNSSSETITEDTFKGGASDVYVSCYRVTQDGLNIDTIEALLPKLSNVNELKSALTDYKFRVSGGKNQYSPDGGTTWIDLDSGMPSLDFANAVDIPTTANSSITTTKKGAIIGGFGGFTGYASNLYVNDKIVAIRPTNGNTQVQIYGLSVGDVIKIDTAVANAPKFIPYK